MTDPTSSCVAAVGGLQRLGPIAKEFNVVLDSNMLAFLECYGSLLQSAGPPAPPTPATCVRNAIKGLENLSTQVREEVDRAVCSLEGAERDVIAAWEVVESVAGLPLVAVQCAELPLLFIRVSSEYAERMGRGVSFGLRVGKGVSLAGAGLVAMQRLESHFVKQGKVINVGDLVSKWAGLVVECTLGKAELEADVADVP